MQRNSIQKADYDGKKKKSSMKILVNFTNRLYYEAIKNLLTEKHSRSGRQQYIVEDTPNEKFVPDIILVDFFSLNPKLLSRHIGAKVILVDTGLEQEVIASLMFTYSIDGVLSCDTDSHLLRKALTAVSSGEIWLDNNNVKALLNKEGFVLQRAAADEATPWEKEVI